MKPGRHLYWILLPLLAGSGCDSDQVVVPALRNQGPEASLEVETGCVLQSHAVVFDVSRTTDDRTDDRDLEYRIDWESDGAYDTPWTRAPEFSRRYPPGEHEATVCVRDEEFQVSTATCGVLVVQDQMPVAVEFAWFGMAAFTIFNGPDVDPVDLRMQVRLRNESDLWIRDITLGVRAYSYYSNALLAEIPVKVTRDGSDWNGLCAAETDFELLLERRNREEFLFEPPCYQPVYLELLISVRSCWDTVQLRTPPFVFTCIASQGDSGIPGGADADVARYSTSGTRSDG